MKKTEKIFAQRSPQGMVGKALGTTMVFKKNCHSERSEEPPAIKYKPAGDSSGFALRMTIVMNILLFSLLGAIKPGFCQNVGISATGVVPDASAMLDVVSTTKGALIPRMTQVQRDAITLPATSLLIYQTDGTPGYYYNSGTPAAPNWTRLTIGGDDGWTDDGAVVRLTTISDNVGIGTVSPQGKLHVSGGNIVLGNNNGINLWDGSNLFNVMRGYSTFSAGYSFQISPGAELTVAGGEAAANLRSIGFATGGSENLYLAADQNIEIWTGMQLPSTAANRAMTITNTQLVGIGTTGPSYPLEISRTGGTRAQVGIYSAGDVPNDLFFGNNGQKDRYSITSRGSSEGYDLKIYRNNGGWSPMMTFDWATGNVGINDVSPNGILEVQGDGSTNTVRFSDATGQYRFRFDQFNDLFLTNAAGTDVVKITNDGDDTYFNSGNVGIGTTNPSTKLDVVGVLELSNVNPSDPGSDIVRLGDGGTNLEIQTNYGYTRIGPQNTSWSHFGTDRARYYFDKGITVDQGLIGSYNEDLQLQTSGTTRMTILTSNGNVGIADPTPSEKLDVTGNIRASGTAYWGSSGTRTETKNDAGTFGGRSGYYETSAPAPAANWPAGAGSWWHLLETRHSNTTNNYSMQIAGSFFNQDFWVRKTNNSATTGWAKLITTANVSSYGDNLGNHTATTTLNMVNFNIDNVNRLEFNDPGDQEGIIWSGSAAKIFVSPLNTGNSDGYLRLINDGGIVFEPGAEDIERVTFAANGNVGIGTTGPGDLLDINTTSISSGIELDNRDALTGYSGDTWLRLNQSSQWTSGVYTPGKLRADGGIEVDNIGFAIDASNRYHYSRNTSTNKWGSVNASGWGLDALNSGDWDILVYENQTYTSNLRLGYSGTAILSTYDANENLTIDPNGTGRTIITGQVQITGGTPAAGQVLTSDAAGLATWEPASGSVVQGMSRTISTSEAWIVGNNTGSYSNSAGAGYTPGTYQDVSTTSVTRSITAGNIVKVTFSARWEKDSWNYYTSEMIWFRILRGSTVIATTAVYTEGDISQGANFYFTDGNVSLTVYDTGAPSGSSTWKVQYWLPNSFGAQTERMRIGERYITVTELEP